MARTGLTRVLGGVLIALGFSTPFLADWWASGSLSAVSLRGLDDWPASLPAKFPTLAPAQQLDVALQVITEGADRLAGSFLLIPLKFAAAGATLIGLEFFLRARMDQGKGTACIWRTSSAAANYWRGLAFGLLVWIELQLIQVLVFLGFASGISQLAVSQSLMELASEYFGPSFKGDEGSVLAVDLAASAIAYRVNEATTSAWIGIFTGLGLAIGVVTLLGGTETAIRVDRPRSLRSLWTIAAFVLVGLISTMGLLLQADMSAAEVFGGLVESTPPHWLPLAGFGFFAAAVAASAFRWLTAPTLVLLVIPIVTLGPLISVFVTTQVDWTGDIPPVTRGLYSLAGLRVCLQTLPAAGDVAAGNYWVVDAGPHGKAVIREAKAGAQPTLYPGPLGCGRDS